MLRRESALDPADLAAIRERLGWTRACLGAAVRADAQSVRRWEEGSRPVPRKVERWLLHHLAYAQRERAFEESGLESCTWLAEWLTSQPQDVSVSWMAERIDEHQASCPTCIPRAEWESSQPPLPPEPAPWWNRPTTWAAGVVEATLEPFPRWMRPAVGGALVMMPWSVLYSYEFFYDASSTADAFSLAADNMVWKMAAGAAGGSVFVPLRRWLRGSGAERRYVPCIAALFVGLLVDTFHDLRHYEGVPPSLAQIVVMSGIMAVFGGSMWAAFYMWD